MSTVYFFPTDSNDYSYLGQVAKELVARAITDNNIKLHCHIPLKVHFGEDGNVTYIPAIAYDGIIDLLKSKNKETSFIETNVLYSGKRMYRSSHIELAKSHGFTRVPIIIADGNIGENYYLEAIDGKHYQKCKIGAEFQKFAQMIVCSHFKGHQLAGFGGAIKQLAMGFAARGGKLDQHSAMYPLVRKDACTGCKKCLAICSVNAIEVISKAEINHKLCITCAGCIAMCPKKAIYHDWGADYFLEKLAEYAYAATRSKEFIYVTFISNVTKDCDCIGINMKPIAENVGVMVSLDPVAIDTAALDQLQTKSNSRLFDIGRKTLEYAEKMEMGSMKYEISE
jgi:hypothetical protein